MKQRFSRIVTVLALIYSLMLACSLTIPAASPSQSQPGFRYDGLASKVNESSAISE